MKSWIRIHNWSIFLMPLFILTVLTASARALQVASEDGLVLELSPDGKAQQVMISGTNLLSSVDFPFSVLEHQLDAVGSNLVSNGGFETDENRDLFPDGWEFYEGTNGLKAELNDVEVKEGEKSLWVQIDPNFGERAAGGLISLPITVQPFTRYRLGAFIKASNGYLSKSGAAVFWQQSLYQPGTTDYISGLYYQCYDSDGQPISFPQLATPLHVNAFQWKRIGADIVTPANAASIRIIISALLNAEYNNESFYIDELTFNEITEEPWPVGGIIASTSNGLEQTAQFEEQGLTFTATYRGFKDHIAIEGTVTDLTDTDRAIEVRFALPINAQDWTWTHSLRQSDAIDTSNNGPYYQNVVNGDMNGFIPLSLYPYAGIGNADAGIALAIPLNRPNLYTIRYNVVHRTFEIVFYLGISPAADKLGSSARFAFVLYRYAPEWQMRAVIDKYHAIFAKTYPNWFQSRIDGTAYRAFRQGAYETPNGSNKAKWHDLLHIYSAEYIGSEYVVNRMGDDPDPPLYEDILATIDTRKTAPDEITQAYYQSMDQAAGSDTNGDLILKHVGIYTWSQGQWETSFLADMDPDIPGGFARWLVSYKVDAAFQATAANGAQLDGVEIDNFMSLSTVDVNADHFPYADLSLSYSPVTFQPGVHKISSLVEFLSFLRRHLDTRYGMNKGISVNWWGLGTTNFHLPFIDFLGAEGSKVSTEQVNFSDDILDYKRALAYEKPLGFANQETNINEDELRRFCHKSLFYGMSVGVGGSGDAQGWPRFYKLVLGRFNHLNRRLIRAGWEPLTFAASDIPIIHVERFGQSSEEIYFTTFNSDLNPHTYTLTIDLKALNLHTVTRIVDMITGTSYAFSPSGTEVTFQDRLPAKSTRMFLLLGS